MQLAREPLHKPNSTIAAPLLHLIKLEMSSLPMCHTSILANAVVKFSLNSILHFLWKCTIDTYLFTPFLPLFAIFFSSSSENGHWICHAYIFSFHKRWLHLSPLCLPEEFPAFISIGLDWIRCNLQPLRPRLASWPGQDWRSLNLV